MNQKQTKKCMEVMQAFIDGKAILNGDNDETDNPCWNWKGDCMTYSIKPEPKYRPYTENELIKLLKSNLGILRVSYDGVLHRADFVGWRDDDDVTVVIQVYTSKLLPMYFSMEEALEVLTHEDGTPFGAKEE